jgi:hypothetical protein
MRFKSSIQLFVNASSKLLREEAARGAQNIGQALDRVGMRMSNAQYSLTALRPVLENLREPFILQAVPIKANGL